MGKTRLEAFSDGVLAIIITIMVLELKVPRGAELADLQPLLPVFLAYVLSFTYVGIYWNNHHHLLSTVEEVSGGILWANLILLFWLSLLPFATAWLGENLIGENQASPLPTVLYGGVLLLSAIAYYILQLAIIGKHGPDSTLRIALGSDWKGKLSPLAYIVGIALAYVNPWISSAIYASMACIWVVPDRRIERVMTGRGE